MEFDKGQLCTIALYRWRCGLNATQIYKEITHTLQRDAVSLRVLQNWLQRFSQGEFDVDDKDKSGRPPDDDMDNLIEEQLSQNKHATCR